MDETSITPFSPDFQPYQALLKLTSAKQFFGALHPLSRFIQNDKLNLQLFPQKMPSSDYTSAASGGLRLKGVNPSSKITKHKKKRPKPAEQSSDPTTSDPKSKSQDPNHDNLDKTPAEKLKVEEIHNQDHRDEDVLPRPAGKTEAELRHEERRRRRVCTLLSLNFPPHFPFLISFMTD